MYDQWSFKLLSTIGVIIYLIFIDIIRDVHRWLTLKEKDVRNQCIVITGGGSGLGRRTAHILSMRGAKLVIIDVNEKGAQEAVEEIKRDGGHATYYICDITEEEKLKSVARQIVEEYGQVDIVICNAAILSFGFFMELPTENLQKTFDVNVMGTINTIRAFLGDMESRNRGHIVCVSSVAGFSGETYGLAYCPSKFAIRGVMECLQMELRDRGLEGIACTTVCPYFARTPMVLNAGMRPTCTWFPFMSIDSCSRRIVDAVLKEKSMAFMPNYVTMVPMIKGLLSINVSRRLREYLGIKYEPSPSAISSIRQVIPTMSDYFSSPHILWWILIPAALLVNFWAWSCPEWLEEQNFAGYWIGRIGKEYSSLLALTNIFALVAHLGEAIYALQLCERARFSLSCSAQWFLQTLLLGYPSLSLLQNQTEEKNNNKVA